MICPKCIGFLVDDFRLCDKHKKEFDAWDKAAYISEEQCKCSKDPTTWIEGYIQMINPPTDPMIKVWRCKKCDSPKMEESEDGKWKRLVERDE